MMADLFADLARPKLDLVTRGARLSEPRGVGAARGRLGVSS